MGSQTVCEGVVHDFDISGPSAANRAYAWSSPIEGSEKRRFFAVLHLPPITSLVNAVRAAIVAEHRDTGDRRNPEVSFLQSGAVSPAQAS
jgi:hypothetical protein